MKIELKGRRAVVTASTSGIGFAIARGLAGAGADVVINGRNPEVTAAAIGRLKESHPACDILGISADLGTSDGVDRFIDTAGDIDILVNNLGIYERVDFFDITDAEWLRFFETNVMSGVRLARRYMPGMIAKDWGRLIFISSESGVTTPRDRMHYAVTKSAVLAVARGLAEQARGTAVTSNSVIVGLTMTEHVERDIARAAEEKKMPVMDIQRQIAATYRPTQLLERLATSEEVANMVTYIASPQASATTGSALRVEGGGITTIL
ncbi:NAD(P)-dependent dehydrogenase (short-subunit alcohol dehydrogenase family) [Sphingobium xenophagum]|uniref:NAD(P)-dependent dehydrogenase (Short-subunit alcohol dehydrogenase family) n=1 Tax=Sphingobium xenophagum TaxID=121428 RepID=A0ABU1X4G5_SPHXE|nr:SDR family oxidoreductase [Sphingobium xenophagum]MDR7156448.1 NAD(P)-dependent dehydrogenase (short-subunit alcohol dehydrogenase family) [Sphingobium xenophagum]